MTKFQRQFDRFVNWFCIQKFGSSAILENGQKIDEISTITALKSNDHGTFFIVAVSVTDMRCSLRADDTCFMVLPYFAPPSDRLTAG